MIITFIVFLVVSSFFAFSESATIASQRVLLHHAASEGDPRARLIEALRDNPRRFFGTTLIGTNICIFIMSAVGAHRLLHEHWAVPLFVATITVDIIILVLAEIVPKTLSLSNPTASSLRAARLLESMTVLLKPLVWLITWLPSKLINIEHIFHQDEDEIITESQIVHMIGLSARQGGIETTEGERAVKVFKFADTTVEQAMTPRPDMVTLSPGMTLADALRLANSTGYSRMPVLTEDGQDSPGFIAAKDILDHLLEGNLDQPVDNFLRKLRFIPESSRLLNLLGEFRTSGEQIAIVVDEFGSITGLITLEDLLEEVTGEIYDEHDSVSPEIQWVKGSLVVKGSYPADELAARLKVPLPDGDYDTAAGLFLHIFDKVPEPGEFITLDGWKLVATHVVSHRITRIIARRIDDIPK